MSVQSTVAAFANRRPVMSKAPLGTARNLTEAAAMPHSTPRNHAWGFYGGVYDSDAHGEHADNMAGKLYATAHKHLVQKHGVHPAVARNFLDSKHGRWMADAIKGGYVKGGTVDTKKDKYGEMGRTVNPKLTGAHIEQAIQSNYHGKHAQAFDEIKKATASGEFEGSDDAVLDRGPALTEALSDAQVATAMAKAKSNTPAQHAADVRAVADANLKAGKKRWNGDSHMLSMVYKDHGNMHDVARHIEAGRPSAAHDHAMTMDSAARDEIPHHVWLHIGGELVGKKTYHKLGESTWDRAATPRATVSTLSTGKKLLHVGTPGVAMLTFHEPDFQKIRDASSGVSAVVTDDGGKQWRAHIAPPEPGTTSNLLHFAPHGRMDNPGTVKIHPDKVLTALDAHTKRTEGVEEATQFPTSVLYDKLDDADHAAFKAAMTAGGAGHAATSSKSEKSPAGETIMHVHFPTAHGRQAFTDAWHTHINGRIEKGTGAHLSLGHYAGHVFGEGVDHAPGVTPQPNRHQLLMQRMNAEADRITKHRKTAKKADGPKKVAEALAPKNIKF